MLNPSQGYRKKKSTKEKEAVKKQAMKDLIVSHEENVDGGYLAPYGVYNSNLDYATDIVRRLIIDRRIAPFYIPLEDFNETWTDHELLVILDKLPLHSHIAPEIEQDLILDPNSKHYPRHLAARMFEKSLLEKRIQLQNDAENKFVREKKLANVNGFRKDNIASKDLLLLLYRNPKECPICFLFYPNNFNFTRCCAQPICSECFVQIKRIDPHPPHDVSEQDASPKDLISEVAKCPFCAMPEFGVTYIHPTYKLGIGGLCPYDFRGYEKEESNGDYTATLQTIDGRRRDGISPDDPSVITTDYIRPDWELKLNAARMKLARRSAAATAIHASSLIMSETGEGETRQVLPESNANLEQKMIEEAMRLSLLEEEERQNQSRR